MQCLDNCPIRRTPRLMVRNARGHLGVAGFRGCHIDPRWRQRRDQALAVPALTRAGPARDERDFCGHRLPTMAAAPTPRMISPATRGAETARSVSKRRVTSAIPIATTL